LNSRHQAPPRKAVFLAIAALLFILSARLAVAQETLLYSFSFNTLDTYDGAAPIGNLISDSNGNLYGATSSGGSSSDGGMIFELSPKVGGGWTEKILYPFTGNGGGTAPTGSLIFDSNGNLYGTASNIVFELSPQSGGVWTEKVLYTFNGGETDVSAPNGGLIFDKSGNLYGTSSSGGAYDAYGTVYELSPPESGTGPWTEQILHSFNNNFVDGYRPLGSLIFDPNGNLYGTTSYGGANGQGTVFELTPGSGGVWTESIIFNQSYSETPYANLIFDTEGNLYSTSFSGGAEPGDALNGTVFELSPPQSGTAWTEQILHSFGQDATDGGSLAAGLISDTKGNLYSTTFHGGPYYTEGVTANTDGTIFELLPQQTGGYAEDVLYFFGTATNDGVLPTAGVISDSKGNLYGVTSEGGAYGYGAVFEYTPVPTVPAPVFSLDQGIYPSTQTVTVTDATEGAMLYCTIDGTTPTTSSPMCPASFTVSATETIQAIAVYTGVANSPVANAAYLIEPPAATPIIYPDGGNFTTTAPMVSITDSTPGAKIYYSTTGGAPYTLYTFGFTLSSSETITAYAVANGYTQSLTTSATFKIDLATRLFSPAPGSTLPVGPVTFHWTPGTGATGYALWAGTTGTGSGSDNLYYSGEKASTVTSLTVSGLPINGETIYIRLVTYKGSSSTFTTYTYTASSGGILTTPAPGSTLGGSSTTFSWTAGTGATGYALWIGSSATDADNLYYSGEQAPTVTSLTVNGLPMNGETIYVRLITYYASSSAFTTYTYTAAVAGILTTPTPGSTLAGPRVTFSWSAGTNATGYALWIGSTPTNADNLYYSGEKASTVTSLTVSGLPLNGETIYVRLITYYGAASSFNSYTYTTPTAGILTTPTPGSTLAGPSITFSWTAGTSATGYALWIGSTPTDADNLYYSGEKAPTVTSLTVNGLPVNGETIYIRLITYYGSASSYSTYTYTSAGGGI
jgi:uncharacterized repeat protein (TIGR03803 family)